MDLKELLRDYGHAMPLRPMAPPFNSQIAVPLKRHCQGKGEASPRHISERLYSLTLPFSKVLVVFWMEAAPSDGKPSAYYLSPSDWDKPPTTDSFLCATCSDANTLAAIDALWQEIKAAQAKDKEAIDQPQ